MKVFDWKLLVLFIFRAVGVIKAFIAVLSVIQFLGCLSLQESIPFDASHVKIQSELQVNRKTTLSVSGK